MKALLGVWHGMKELSEGWRVMKAMMSWSDTMSVGDPEIDEQHRTLFSLLNELYVAFLEGTAHDRLGMLFDDLASYTRLHFRNEEIYFEQFGYPELEAHVAAHAALTQKLAAFRERYGHGEEDLTIEMIHFLRDWILGHIMQMDFRYRPFFAKVVRGKAGS